MDADVGEKSWNESNKKLCGESKTKARISFLSGSSVTHRPPPHHRALQNPDRQKELTCKLIKISKRNALKFIETCLERLESSPRSNRSVGRL